MLSRFRQWLAAGRARRKAHDLAWNALIEPDESGISPFQTMAASAIVEAIPGLSLGPAGEHETYLTGQLPDCSATVFIYHSQAEVFGGPTPFPGEYQDFDGPDELIHDFVAAAKRAIAA